MNCCLRWAGMVVHCADGLYCVSALRVDFSVCSAGREKVTGSVGLDDIAVADAAILLALSRFVCVR